jgi:RNA polymerase sigma-70 factor (ECF subfamily)
MHDTQPSLLMRARQGEGAAWPRLVELYQPLIRGWLSRQQVRPADVEDLTQDVLAAVVKDLPRFEHAGRPGAFRGWLRTITVNRARAFWRAGAGRAQPAGGDEFLDRLAQLEDPSSKLARRWDQEHDRHVLTRLLALLEPDFEPATVRAFQRLTFDGAPAQEVATELGISPVAVYGAKARVLQRLRQEAEGLLD